MPDTDTKEALKKYGIFVGIFVGMSMLLLCFVLLAHSSWKHGLAQTVQDSLNYYYPDSYVVGDFYEVESIISTSAAVFTVKSKNANTKELSAYCVMVRIPTIIGEQPALFLYTSRTEARFVGYVIDAGKAKNVLDAEVGKTILSYWKTQIPLILEKAGI